MARASRGGDTPSRAERLKRVEELVADAVGRGLVGVDREAAPYIAPDDPRVVERVDGGSGWARYTLRLADGAVYQEGGARRAFFVAGDTARELVRAAAAQAVEQSRTLHQMLSLYNRARYGGKGRTAVQEAVAEPALLGRLEERIRDRAPHETQRLEDVELLDALRRIGAPEAVIKRLTGDRTLSEEVRSTLRRWPERVDAAASIEAELDERLRSGDVALDETVVGPVRPSAAVGAEVVPGGERWWTFAVRTADGGLHLDGGSRRLRVVAPEVAERLIADRISEILSLTDLRVLLHHRAGVADRGERSLLYRAFAADAGAVERLDERIRAVAAGASFDPPLGDAALRALHAAGVDDDTIRRLGHVLELPMDQQAAVQERLRASVTVQAGDRLDALLQDRIAKGFAELRDDTAPYVGAFDPEVTERLPEGVAPWARHVVVLEDGSVHMEGGRTRVRLCPPGVAKKLIERRAAELLAEPDLLRLLSTAVRVRRDPSPGTAYGYLAAARRWAAVLDRVRALAADPAFAGRIKRKDHIEILVEAGTDREALRGLTGDVGPTVEQRQEAAARLQQARSQAPGAQLDERLEACQAKGWVELHEDTVPYVHATQEGVVEVFPPAAAPGMRHVVVLADGSIHLEGGRTRVRLCEPARAAALLDARLAEVLAETDLHVLLGVATRVRTAVSGRSIYGHIRERSERHEALLARIREQSDDPTWRGRVTRKDHQDVLAEAGVDPAVRRRLAGEVGLTLEQERARLERLREARATSPSDRLDELLATRQAEGWVEIHEDTAPFVAATSPEVKELLPAQAAPGMRHVVVLRDGSVHLEGGRTRVRLCSPKRARELLAARYEEVLREEDLFVLLDLGVRVRAGGSALRIYGYFASDPRRRSALLGRICERAADPAYAGRVSRKDHLDVLADAGLDEAALRSLSGAVGLTLEQERARLDGLRVARATSPSDRLDELLARRRAEGWLELYEDTVPFVPPTSPEVAELLPAQAAPAMRHVAVLRDGSVHLEGGRTRVRLCGQRLVDQLLAARFEAVMSEDDVFKLLDVGLRMQAGAPERTIFAYIARDPRRREALLGRLRERASDPAYSGRITRSDHLSLLADAGLDEASLRSMSGATGLTLDQQREALERLRAARATTPAERLSELLEQKRAAGWVELHEDVVPFVATTASEVAEVLPPSAAPGMRHVIVMRDGSVHLEGGRTRVRLCDPRRAKALIAEAFEALLAEDDLFRLLEAATRVRRSPPENTVHRFVETAATRREALLRRIRERAADPAYAGRISRKDHLEGLREAGVADTELASLGRPGAVGSEGPAAKRPSPQRKTPPADRLAELLAERSGPGWVELHEDAAPFLAADDPHIRERLPAKAAPWTRNVAVLDDDSLHLEGGRTRIRLCRNGVAERLLGDAASRILASEDLIELLDFELRCRAHPPRTTAHGYVVASTRLHEALLERIRQIAGDRQWDGRIKRRPHLELLEELGVDSMRVLFLQGIVHRVADAAAAGQGGTGGEKGGPEARARGRLERLVQARQAEGWVTLPTESVPYVAETDPRVREVFVAPDGMHRFAAVLDDGTIVHEGGTSRFWIVPRERAGEVLEERARYLLRTSNVYTLLDLYLSSRHVTPRSTPTERLFAERPELAELLTERIREEVRSRDLRFTRPDHLEALQLMGLAPGDNQRAARR